MSESTLASANPQGIGSDLIMASTIVNRAHREN